MLTALLASVEKVPIKARRVAALLDQLELDVARIGERDRQMRDVVALASVAVAGERQAIGIKPRPDAAHLDPVPHRLVDIAHDDADLPHLAKNPAHTCILPSVLELLPCCGDWPSKLADDARARLIVKSRVRVKNLR